MQYLLIVEGAKTEPRLFKEIFNRYGFQTFDLKRPKTFFDYDFSFEETVFNNGIDTIYIMQAPQNRIENFIDVCIQEDWDLNKAFHTDDQLFNGIFLIFDVDHTSNEKLSLMMDRFSDEFDEGLLIISLPCVEVVSDPGRVDSLDVNHLKEYKSECNQRCHEMYKKGAVDYIIDCFEELLIKFLDKNEQELCSHNVMEHPNLVVKEINKVNERHADFVHYRYFTTVLYVVLACVMGLVKNPDNVESLRKFLNNMVDSKRRGEVY